MNDVALRLAPPVFAHEAYARANVSHQPFHQYFSENSMLSALHEGRVALASFVDNEYHHLSPTERSCAYQIICDPSFVKKHSRGYALLKARLNPGNQFRVKTSFNGHENIYHCFCFEGRFHTGAELFLKESYITEVVQLASASDC